jgi:phosphate transport system substrate-binding protein
MRPRLRALFAVLVATVAISVAIPATAAHASAAILGGGSGFAALEIDQWRAETARSPYNLSINYVAQGSTYGRNQFAAGAFDFGASDIQYPDNEIPGLQTSPRCQGKALANCFVYVPVSAGGLAFMYNLHDSSGNQINNLRLTRDVACKIFTGQITHWNDPAIASLNPRLASVSLPIRPVVREDGAGESYVFSEFCLAVDPDVWHAFIDQQIHSSNTNLDVEFTSGRPTSRWPASDWANGVNPIPVAYADGTANYVADPSGGNGAITYVAAGYAKVRSFPVASLQNAAGLYTQPDEDNVTVALGYATPRGNGTFQLAFNGPDPRAYFPSTYSYVLAQTTGFDTGKGATLGQFLCYAVSQGQVFAPDLRYARLSAPLVQIAINAIIEIPGAPAKNNCFVAGAPPPPPPPSVQGGGSGFGGSGGGSTGGTSGASGTNGASAGGGSNSTSVAARIAALGKNATAAQKAKVAAAARAAAAAAAAAQNTTTTTSPDAQLQSAAAQTPQGTGSNTPVIWLLIAGVGAALVINLIASRRRSV